MRVAFFEAKEEEKEFFKKALDSKVELEFFEDVINKYENLDRFDVVSVFINSKIDKEVLDRLKNVKYIQTRSTGYDHIDIVECYKRGILVSNVRNYAGPAVGEFAYGLLLEAIRKIYVAIERVKRGNLEYKDLKGREIAGKTIGVLGLGAIGRNIANIAKGFGAEVIAYVRSKKDIDIPQSSDLKEVLRKSDYLFIALPLTPQTKHLINKESIKDFKGSVIINPARAEIISREVYEIFDGIIAADVLNDWQLAQRDNIIATPHMAYYTQEALRRIMQISLENLEDFLRGEIPRYCLKSECRKNYGC